MTFDRRALLRAAGATLLLPGWARHAFASARELPPRLAILMWANGTNPAGFWPTTAFQSPILAPLLDDPELRARTTVVKGVRLEARGPGNEHDLGFNSFWTGVPAVGRSDDSFGGGPSIDQQLRRRLALDVPYPTLNCGVLAQQQTQKNGHRMSFSYVGPRQQVPTQTDLYRIWNTLFRPDGEPAGAAGALRAEVRLRQRRSVLDHVSEDLRLLAGRLGPNERAKLDAHATALRELEGRLGSAVRPSAACGARPAPVTSLDITDEDDVGMLAPLMMDLVAAALACNLTRIVTFQFGPCGNNWRCRWLGIGIDSHGVLAHGDHGQDQEISAKRVTIGRWHAAMVGRLAKALHAVPDGEGSALDNSLLVWTNENATGNHGLENLPVVLLGRAGGRLTSTGRVVDAGVQPHHRLGTSVMRLMGLDVAGFGERQDCGPLRGL